MVGPNCLFGFDSTESNHQDISSDERLRLAVAENARDGETTSLHSRLLACMNPNARNPNYIRREHLVKRILCKKFFEHQLFVLSSLLICNRVLQFSIESTPSRDERNHQHKK
jgi:hypothetical protein